MSYEVNNDKISTGNSADICNSMYNETNASMTHKDEPQSLKHYDNEKVSLMAQGTESKQSIELVVCDDDICKSKTDGEIGLTSTAVIDEDSREKIEAHVLGDQIQDENIAKTESYEYLDFTEMLKKSCEMLKKGEIITAPKFTLADTLNALELMSPRFDSGMNPKPFLSIQDRYLSGSISIPPKNDFALISICDVSCIFYRFCLRSLRHFCRLLQHWNVSITVVFLFLHL